jgi:multiple sugar transport system substrate-binding protein
VYRPDLLDAGYLPRDWTQMLVLGHGLRRKGQWLGLATAAPHGILVLLALCANLGRPVSQDPWATPFDAPTLDHATELLLEAVALAHPAGRSMNAIQLHDAMVATDDMAYCPAAYAYLCYADADQRRPLRFAPFPGPAGNVAGTALGGTGLGVTRSCRDIGAAMRLVQWLSTSEAQLELVMGHHGQPGCAQAWTGVARDDAFGGAHAAVRETVQAAWTRPRFPGYLRWQAQAGELVEQLLEGAISKQELGRRLDILWRACAPRMR